MLGGGYMGDEAVEYDTLEDGVRLDEKFGFLGTNGLPTSVPSPLSSCIELPLARTA